MANWSSPIVLPGPADAHPVVVLQSGDGLCAVDAAAGSEVWRYAEGAATIPSSALGDEVLVVPSHGLTALKPGAPGLAPARLWRAAQIRPDTASPIVLGDRVYVVNAAGVLNCGDLATGQRLWQVRLKGPFSSSPVAAGSFLCLFNEKGLGQMVDLSKSEGEVIAELDLGQTILASPAIAGGALYLRSDATLWKIVE
jgi:outer membrane protein assembly factor BamB